LVVEQRAIQAKARKADEDRRREAEKDRYIA
jgi:hypothetical protein